MSKIHPLIFGLLSFLISLYLFPYYTLGDQQHYRLFYSEISFFPFWEGFKAYKNFLGASEPIYYFIVYFLNSYFDKDLLFSIINGIFGFFLAKNLLKFRISIFVLYPLLLNFYFLVLLFAAERLKVSILFFLISVLCQPGFKQYFFIFLTVLSHIQSFMIVFVQKINDFRKQFIVSFIRGSIFKIFLLIIVALGFFIVIYLMREYFSHKISAYSDNGGVYNLIKPFVFCVLTIYYSKSKWYETFFLFIPFFIGSIIVGEERIVIFCYGLFLYYAIQVNRGLNWAILVTNVYFIFKGVEFLFNIVNFRNGFP